MSPDQDIRTSIEAHLQAIGVGDPVQAARARVEFAAVLRELGLVRRAARESRKAHAVLRDLHSEVDASLEARYELELARMLDAERVLTELDDDLSDLEEQTQVEAQRMRTAGPLVASVAHEINNPNHFVMLNVPFLREAWDDAVAILRVHVKEQPDFRLANTPFEEAAKEMPELLAELQEGAERVRRLVRQLREFTEPGSEREGTQFDLNDELEVVLALLSSHLKRTTRGLAVELESGLPQVRADRRRLQQVLASLLLEVTSAKTAGESKLHLDTRQEDDEVILELYWEQGEVGYNSSEFAVLHRILARMNGRIEVETVDEVATRITLRLKLSRSPS